MFTGICIFTTKPDRSVQWTELLDGMTLNKVQSGQNHQELNVLK